MPKAGHRAPSDRLHGAAVTPADIPLPVPVPVPAAIRSRGHGQGVIRSCAPPALRTSAARHRIRLQGHADRTTGRPCRAIRSCARVGMGKSNRETERSLCLLIEDHVYCAIDRRGEIRRLLLQQQWWRKTHRGCQLSQYHTAGQQEDGIFFVHLFRCCI